MALIGGTCFLSKALTALPMKGSFLWELFACGRFSSAFQANSSDCQFLWPFNLQVSSGFENLISLGGARGRGTDGEGGLTLLG